MSQSPGVLMTIDGSFNYSVFLNDSHFTARTVLFPHSLPHYDTVRPTSA